MFKANFFYHLQSYISVVINSLQMFTSLPPSPSSLYLQALQIYQATSNYFPPSLHRTPPSLNNPYLQRLQSSGWRMHKRKPMQNFWFLGYHEVTSEIHIP